MANLHQVSAVRVDAIRVKHTPYFMYAELQTLEIVFKKAIRCSKTHGIVTSVLIYVSMKSYAVLKIAYVCNYND